MRRRQRKRTLWCGIVLAALTVWTVLLFYGFGREKRAVRRAVLSLTQSNYPAASLYARRALLLNSNSAAACRVMAELADHYHSDQAMLWRQRVASLQPGADSNQLALARTALRLQRLSTATQALAVISPQRREASAECQLLAAQAALQERNLEAAEGHLKSAIRLDPTNEVLRFNLAIVQLKSSSASTIASARQSLERHATHAGYGATILRALASDSLEREDFSQALNASARLQERPDATFEDRIFQLTLLWKLSRDRPSPGSSPPGTRDSERSVADPVPFGSGNPSGRELNEFLLLTEREAARDADRVALLARWLVEHELAETALPWLEGLPNEIRNTRGVRLAEAECYLSSRNWRELGAQLAREQWAGDDYLRHALLALCYRQQGEERLARVEWKQAVRAGRESYTAIQSSEALVRLAGAWSWEEEAEELLWELVTGGADAGWALAVLRQSYEVGGNTRGLLRVFTAALRYDPRDLVARNNLAATSLLLRTNLLGAHRLARELHLEYPTNAAVACTYAYSLHLQGRTGEGLEVMSGFRDEMTRYPSAAVYYGALLAAQGLAKDASRYLSSATNSYLLPEERQMLERAAAGVTSALDAAR